MNLVMGLIFGAISTTTFYGLACYAFDEKLWVGSELFLWFTLKGMSGAERDYDVFSVSISGVLVRGMNITQRNDGP